MVAGLRQPAQFDWLVQQQSGNQRGVDVELDSEVFKILKPHFAISGTISGVNAWYPVI
jgi:hypothetical protein